MTEQRRLIKNKARQIIREFAPTNPAFYEKLRERLEKIIEKEENRRKEDADYFNYFNRVAEIYNEVLNVDEKRKDLGFSTQFEFAVYEQLQSLKNDDKTSKGMTDAIYSKVKEETKIIGWKNKKSSDKRMSIAIYDILSGNGYPEDKINETTIQIIDLAKRDL